MFLVWLTGPSALGLIAGVGWYLAPLEPNILVLQFAFTPRAFGTGVSRTMRPSRRRRAVGS